MQGMFKIDRCLSAALREESTKGPEKCGYLHEASEYIDYTIKYNDGSGHPENFLLGALDWKEASERGKIVGIWHTHPDQSPPSEADVRMSHAMNIPVLVVTPETAIYVVDPYPLQGHQFAWNQEDCYTCAMRFYQRRGIWLRHYVRDEDFYKDGHENVLLENFEREGFRVVPGRLLDDDALLVSLAHKNTNHCVMVENRALIAHHKPLRLSIRERMPSYFLNRGIHIRHESRC